MKNFKSYSKPEIQTILLSSLFSRGFCCYFIFLFFFLSVFHCWCWLLLFLFPFFFFFLKLNSWFKVLLYCYLTDIFGFESFSSISTIHSAKKHILTQIIFWSDSFCQITSLIDKEPTPQTWKIWFSEFVFHPVWSLVSLFI